MADISISLSIALLAVRLSFQFFEANDYKLNSNLFIVNDIINMKGIHYKFLILKGGAIIKMKPPIFDRRALIDIGASGPIGGFAVAIIAVIVGLGYSDIIPLEEARKIEGGFSLGNSILFYVLAKIILHIDPSKYDIVLHPVAFAGWIGFLVTSLNLLPIGQLDGGHITYALFGERHEWIAKATIPVLILLGIIFWEGWLIWAFLMILIGYKHPPVVYPQIQLGRKRRVIGWVALLIFILTFTPMPFSGV
jgi:membrane-associated protease RseP (regulator of RpoE activity)